MPEPRVVVCGAGGAIAQALLRKLVLAGSFELHAISRSAAPENVAPSIVWHTCDYSDAALAALAGELGGAVDYLVITNGILHGDGLRPERALREFDADSMATVFATNALLPMRVLGAMTPLLRRAEAPRIAALSARVGSIGDNQLGGWYSYRGSKAALNMMLASAAVEFRRLNPRAKLIAFHPGTTDTPLSKPFQQRVAPDKLFTPDFVADCLWQRIEESSSDGQLSFVDWAGAPIPW